MKHVISLAALAAFCWLAPAASASFEIGMAAYKAEKYSDALDIWEDAASAGDVRAQYHLAQMYEAGKGRILRRDYPRAIRWYEAAARQGHPEALYALGRMSENGTGMRQNYLLALRYYSAAVKYAELPRAHFAIAQMYFHGRGVPQDYLKAIENYIAAAERGYAPAQYVYGALLEQGWGVKQNLVDAYVWYALAARENPKVLEAISMNFNARQAVETVRRKLNGHDLDKAERRLKKWKPVQTRGQNPPE
jgi:hypothetical protein